MNNKFFTSPEDFVSGTTREYTKEAREVVANAGLEALGKVIQKPYMRALIGGAFGGVGGAVAGYYAGKKLRPESEAPAEAPAEEPAYGISAAAAKGWLSPAVIAGSSGLLGGLVSGFMQPVGQAAARKVLAPRAGDGILLEKLRVEDPYISEADDEVIDEAYATMQRFAPTLSSDPNAARSFLREAATSGAGVNYNTIKLLAEAERMTQQI